MHKLKRAKRLAEKLGRGRECGVENCPYNERTEIVWLKPFDPIEHDETPVVLCSYHQDWADLRNALAETIKQELIEARKEIGQEYIDEISELAQPDEGTLDEDYLMGEQ